MATICNDREYRINFLLINLMLLMGKYSFGYVMNVERTEDNSGIIVEEINTEDSVAHF